MAYLGETLALLSAVLFGINSILVKRGLVDSNVSTAMLLDAVVGAVLMSILSLFFWPANAFAVPYVFLFIAAGVCGTFAGRLLQFLGVERLGAAPSFAVANTFPVFSTLIAVVFLGEAVMLPLGVGTALTIAGVVTVSSGGQRLRRDRRLLGLPLLSAVGFGLGVAIRKPALAVIPSSVYAAAVNNWAYLVAFLLLHAVWPARTPIHLTPGSRRPFLLAAIVDAFALLALVGSIEFGEVSVVGPLSAVGPIFVLPLTLRYLRALERVTKPIAIGTGLVVAGVIVITAL
jgi:drug/metabolite transporter (DMT)-like permease